MLALRNHMTCPKNVRSPDVIHLEPVSHERNFFSICAGSAPVYECMDVHTGKSGVYAAHGSCTIPDVSPISNLHDS